MPELKDEFIEFFLAKLGKVSQAHVSIIEPSCDTNTHYAYYHNIKQNVNQINKNEHINRKRLMPKLIYFWLTPQNCDRLQKALKIFKLLAVSCSLKTFCPKFVPKSFKQHKIAFFWRPLALSLNRIFYLKSFLKNKDGIRRWMSWRFFEHCRIGEVFYSWWVLYLVLIECDKNCANLSFKKTRSIVEIFLCSCYVSDMPSLCLNSEGFSIQCRCFSSFEKKEQANCFWKIVKEISVYLIWSSWT